MLTLKARTMPRTQNTTTESVRPKQPAMRASHSAPLLSSRASPFGSSLCRRAFLLDSSQFVWHFFVFRVKRGSLRSTVSSTDDQFLSV